MLDNKKGQIGETITWVIATLVIVVILLISISFTFPLGSEKNIKIKDKEKDFLATKSITSFLRNPDNVGSLELKDYEKFEIEITKLVNTLPNYKLLIPGGNELFASTSDTVVDGVWWFRLYEKEEVKISICDNTNYYFVTDIYVNELKLGFSFGGAKLC